MDGNDQPVSATSELSSTLAVTDVSESPDREPSTNKCQHNPGMDHASSVRRERHDREILEHAASNITMSFDNWTAKNGLDFLGVTPH